MAHTHRWTLVLHLDGCHSSTSSYECSCGAVLSDNAERDLAGDPWAALWMEPVYETIDRDERGHYVKPHVEEVICFRCRELQAGATPRTIRLATFEDGSTWEVVDSR